MKYPTIDALDRRIEKIIKAKVKHYYTDWKNYDRPKYMKLKGSDIADDKLMILLVREYGTWIFTQREIMQGKSMYDTLSYYCNFESNAVDFYLINLQNNCIIKIKKREIVNILARKKI